MKKALKRRISLSLKEIKTKKTPKTPPKPWTSEEKQGPGAAGTNSAGENGNVPEVRLWFFSITRLLRQWGCKRLPRQLCPFRCLPNTTLFPAAHPCQQPSLWNSIHGPVLSTCKDYCPSQFYLDLHLLPPEPPIQSTQLASPEPGRAELCPLNNNFKLTNMTDRLLQSSKQKADKMVLWVEVYDAKPDDLNSMPGNHMMERAKSHKTSDLHM